MCTQLLQVIPHEFVTGFELKRLAHVQVNDIPELLNSCNMSIISVCCCAISTFVAVAFCSHTSTSCSIRLIAFQHGIWISQSSEHSGKGGIRYSSKILSIFPNPSRMQMPILTIKGCVSLLRIP